MSTVIFDLDGTITDPAEGITRSINYALVQLGFEPHPEEELQKYIGPHLKTTFSELMGEAKEDILLRAIELYLERCSTIGYREKRVRLVRFTAFLTVIGIVLNRLNVSLIAFNWDLAPDQRYVPHWMEIWITVSIVTAGVVMFRWIVNRMPILSEHPHYKGMH